MKSIESQRIILHCSATMADKNIGAERVRRWHVDGNGWTDIGYHFVVKTDGTIEQGRSLERGGAHTKGHNNSIGICYIGGMTPQGKWSDTLTFEQHQAITELVKSLRVVFGCFDLHGHNEFSAKACPCFDVATKFPNLM